MANLKKHPFLHVFAQKCSNYVVMKVGAFPNTLSMKPSECLYLYFQAFFVLIIMITQNIINHPLLWNQIGGSDIKVLYIVFAQKLAGSSVPYATQHSAELRYSYNIWIRSKKLLILLSCFTHCIGSRILFVNGGIRPLQYVFVVLFALAGAMDHESCANMSLRYPSNVMIFLPNIRNSIRPYSSGFSPDESRKALFHGPFSVL